MEVVTRDHGRDQDARDGSHGSNRSDGLDALATLQASQGRGRLPA